MTKKFFLFFGFMFSFFICLAQNNQNRYTIRTISFYNLENLFDTINDSSKDDEISPIMEMKGNRSKTYWDKIDKLAHVISQIGKEKTKTSPIIIGVAEVENRKVLEDLVQSQKLMKYNYGIIHYESPDKRGIDVALLYQQKYFKPIHHESFDPRIYANGYKLYTRNQLLVTGYLDDELIHIIVNHWPSRRGGEEKSRRLREKAAYQNTKILSQLKEQEKNPKVIIMGDFNDNPTNSSLTSILKTKANKKDVEHGDLYNPYEIMFKRGYNTLGHRDQINLFDQILITEPFVNKDKKDLEAYKMFKAGIFNPSYLTIHKGRYKGYPFRSFSSGSYTGGYSDHYPVYIYLIKQY